MAVVVRPRSWQSAPPHSHRVQDGHPLAQAMVGAYPCNEGTGAALDRTIQMNTQAIVLNSGAAWSDGKYGRAVALDGTNDYLAPTSGGTFDFERTDPFSFAYLIYRDSNTTYDETFAKGITGASLQGYRIGIIEPNTGFVFAANAVIIDLFSNFASTNYIRVWGGSVPAGVWTHIAVTYTGSSTAAGLALYINGVAQTLTTAQDTLSAGIKVSSTPIRFGTDGAGAGNFFGGRLDHAYMWKRVITPTEVQWLYNDPFAMFQSAPTWNSQLFNSVAAAASTLDERHYPRGELRGMLRGTAA